MPKRQSQEQDKHESTPPGRKYMSKDNFRERGKEDKRLSMSRVCAAKQNQQSREQGTKNSPGAELVLKEISQERNIQHHHWPSYLDYNPIKPGFNPIMHYNQLQSTSIRVVAQATMRSSNR